jgi:TonB family protein
MIGFVIAEDGRTTERQVLYSSDWRFEQAALDALARAEFEPALKQGQPARCRLAIPVGFIQLEILKSLRAKPDGEKLRLSAPPF